MEQYHLQLIKGRSYTGVVSATRKNPDVIVEDEAVAKAAVATGYFQLVETIKVTEITMEKNSEEATPDDSIEVVPTAFGASGEPTHGHLDYTSLMAMKLEELKDLAAEMQIDTTGLRTKSDFAKAISAVEVGIPAGDADGSEADFSE